MTTFSGIIWMSWSSLVACLYNNKFFLDGCWKYLKVSGVSSDRRQIYHQFLWHLSEKPKVADVQISMTPTRKNGFKLFQLPAYLSLIHFSKRICG